MPKFTTEIPDEITVACSGGVDSMFAAHFLQLHGKRKVHLAFFHHQTEDSRKAAKFVQKHHNENHDKFGKLYWGYYYFGKPSNLSQEEHWRDERYKFLEKLKTPVVTAHHLDDCMETYLFSSFNGVTKTIPRYREPNIIRPFLHFRKQYMIAWCEDNDIPWIEDQSNQSTKYTRNYIRHEVMPKVLRVNPGFHKVVKRFEEQQNS